jgi:hypothetical protein
VLFDAPKCNVGVVRRSFVIFRNERYYKCLAQAYTAPRCVSSGSTGCQCRQPFPLRSKVTYLKKKSNKFCKNAFSCFIFCHFTTPHQTSKFLLCPIYCQLTYSREFVLLFNKSVSTTIVAFCLWRKYGRVDLEMLLIFQPVKNSPCLITQDCVIEIDSTRTHLVSLKTYSYLNIILPSTPKSRKDYIIFTFSHSNLLCVSHISRVLLKYRKTRRKLNYRKYA